MSEQEKFQWAVEKQGFTGTFEEWLSLPSEDREEYEEGAEGIGTI